MNADLYNYAADKGIEIMSFPLPKVHSMSTILPDGYSAIGIDTSSLTLAEERVHLGHEIGHCETGSFYNVYSDFDVREKHERRANIYAVKHLIPLDDLMAVLDESCCEVWDLAEYFGVTEEFMRFALCYYNLLCG